MSQSQLAVEVKDGDAGTVAEAVDDVVGQGGGCAQRTTGTVELVGVAAVGEGVDGGHGVQPTNGV
jgi:hypothetical protein